MAPLDRSRSNGAPAGGFRLNKTNGKFMGVSAGIADYFNVDVTLVRLGWVVGTILGFGSLVLIYLAIGLIAGVFSSLFGQPGRNPLQPQSVSSGASAIVSSTMRAIVSDSSKKTALSSSCSQSRTTPSP